MGSTVGFFHVGLTVADMDRALGFYRDVLGLEVLSRRTIREEYAGGCGGWPETAFGPRSSGFQAAMRWSSSSSSPAATPLR